MSYGITSKQEKLLAIIKADLAERDVPRSYEELAEAMGLAAKSGITRLVRGLERRGLVKHVPGAARSIQLVERKCPHCGGKL